MGQHQNLWGRAVDGALAIVWVFITQFLMTGLDAAMSSSTLAFPTSILAMFLVFLLLLVTGWVWDGLSRFYDYYLRGPANLINRHMSIGFTVPIVLICRLPTASAQAVGLIMACFLIAGIIATTTVYFAAWSLQTSITTCVGRLLAMRRRKRRLRRGDEEGQDLSVETIVVTAGGQETKTTLSGSSSVTSTNGYRTDDGPDGHTPSPSLPQPQPESSPRGHQVPTDSGPPPRSSPLCTKLMRQTIENPFAVVSWLVFIAIGIPIRVATGGDLVLTLSLLFALWFSVLICQARARHLRCLQFRPRIRTCLVALLNPVLWTALGLTAYAYADSNLGGRPLASVVDHLQRDTSLSSFLLHPGSGVSAGAGDVSLAILDAGLVSWGLRLWEYRRRLVSAAGVTVLVVSLAMALANVALGPVLAHELGLANSPSYDLAFAARTATLALGEPALQRLGGNVSLNAALVVANGVLFQMGLGLGVGEWLGRVLWRPKTTADDEGGDRDEPGEARLVAAGATIGVNSAAMGTAHLYETQSEAAPYAALSMTVFGVATVGFALVPQLADWVISNVTSPGA